MTHDRWHQVTEIFHAAATLTDGAAREAYLRDACGDDPSLRAEVEALLAGQEEAGSFGERPLVAERSAADHLSSGTRLGPHEILRLVGAGGMGEVYEARDTRLDRVVAVKVLPSELGSDPERRARFVREAKTIAKLNHPHICTLYDVGRHEDTDYLVMELLEGETLADRLTNGPLPIDDALRYGTEISDALATAHKIGVVHRDLKPGNIMLTKAGAKLLDFGLAKLKPPVGTGESTTQHEVTAEGAILGTLQYMAPEQLEGRDTDARTDIFAFGAVLYEMLTGEKAFEGESQASLIGAILHTDPPAVSSLQPLVPVSLDRLVRTCLEKDPDARWQSAADLTRELTWSRSDSAPAPNAAAPAPMVGRRRTVRGRRVEWLAGSVAVVLLAAWGVDAWWAAHDAPGPSVSDFERLTSAAAYEDSPSLSPDGQEVLYDSGSPTERDIWLHHVGAEYPVNLTPDSPGNDSWPAYSPDGETIAFHSDRAGGGIFTMGPTGEMVTQITSFGTAPSWSPDGTRLVFHDGRQTQPGASLWTVDLETKVPRNLEVEGGTPAWSPDGRWIAYALLNLDIWIVPAEGGAAIRVTDEEGRVEHTPAWSPDGRFLYFSSDRGGTQNVWRVRINAASGRPDGAFEPMNLQGGTSVGNISIAQNGLRVAYAAETNRGDYYRIGYDAATGFIRGAEEQLTRDSRIYDMHDLHPDGERFVLESGRSLFAGRVGDPNPAALTNDDWQERSPRWSPDGSTIAVQSNHGFGRPGSPEMAYEIFTIDPGTGRRRLLTDMKQGRPGMQDEWVALNPLWAPDGSEIVFFDASGTNAYVFDPRVPWSEQELTKLPDPEGRPNARFRTWSWSAELGLLGCLGEGERRMQVPAAYDFETQEYTVLSDIPGCGSAYWLEDGRVIVNSGPNSGYGSAFLLDPADGTRRELLAPNDAGFVRHAKPSADNRYIYYLRRKAEEDIWIADLIGDGGNGRR